MNNLQNQHGIALVVTLLALVMITAMVVEFSYGVYTGTNALYNWRDSQRLSVMAQSGVNVSARFLSDSLQGRTYSYPGSMEYPVENPFEDFSGAITVGIVDESAKFNINTIVTPRGENEFSYPAFKRLLRSLSLSENIADRIVDWIDKNSEAKLPDSETGAKNAYLDSTDELLQINGISRKDYDTLLPYITVYGNRDNLMININGAEKPVLRCLSDEITDDLAQRIMDYRKAFPFEEKSQLQKVSGITSRVYNPLSNYIGTKGNVFSLKSTASSGGVKRIIDAVIDTDRNDIEYWKEY